MKMKYERIVKLSFLGLLLINVIALSYKSIAARNILISAGTDFTFAQLNALQKPIALINIIFFSILLILANWSFYLDKRKIYIYLVNLVFVGFTLFNYSTLTRMFFELNGQKANESGSYWLIVFIGMFYIVGAITISVIALITVRNLNNRHRDNENQSKSKNKNLSFK